MDLERIKSLYNWLGWDPKYAAADVETWDNPNDLDIAEELAILCQWTRRNQWRRFTQADYRMRFQAWLRRTKREQPRTRIETVETINVKSKSDPMDEFVDLLPDSGEDWPKFTDMIIDSIRSGTFTPEMIEVSPIPYMLTLKRRYELMNLIDDLKEKP